MRVLRHTESYLCLPGQAEGLNPEPTNKRDTCHPVVGSGFFASLSPGMTAAPIKRMRSENQLSDSPPRALSPGRHR